MIDVWEGQKIEKVSNLFKGLDDKLVMFLFFFFYVGCIINSHGFVDRFP